MDFFTLLLFALGLSVDSFAISVTSGLYVQGIRFTQAVKIAFTLALFQGGIMLLSGWAIGWNFQNMVKEWDHWIAFGLLSLVGLKMIWESLKNGQGEKNFNPLKWIVLLGVSIATSIDSLVVGLTFAFLNIHILWAGFVIGFVTFFISMTGLFFGKKIGERFSHRLEIVGAFVLIGIGLKILISHLNGFE
jgi:putative Mn2+ efflux pump MntP